MTAKLSAYGCDASVRLHFCHVHKGRELLENPQLMYKYVESQKLKKFLAPEFICKAKEAVPAGEKELRVSPLVSNGWVVVEEHQRVVLTCDVMKKPSVT